MLLQKVSGDGAVLRTGVLRPLMGREFLGRQGMQGRSERIDGEFRTIRTMVKSGSSYAIC